MGSRKNSLPLSAHRNRLTQLNLYLMQKVFVFICAIIIASTTSHAQTGLHIGAQGGFNSVWILNQNNYGFQELDYSRKFGFLAGASVGYNFEETLGFQVDLNYATMGQDYFDLSKDFCNIDNDGDNKPDKVETFRYVDLSYIQVPMMFKYTSPRKKKQIVSVHILAGPTIGILSGAEMYYEADTLALFNDTYFTIPGDSIDYMVPEFYQTEASEVAKDYFSKVDIGLTVDFGADIFVTKNLYISPALRFYAAATDLNSKPTRERRKDIETGSYEGASRNAYGGLTVGVHYMLNTK